MVRIKLEDFVRLLFFLVLAAFFVWMIPGCSPSKNAHKYFNEHRQEFAQDCSEAFPCIISGKDSTSTSDTTRKDVNPIVNNSLGHDLNDDSLKGIDIPEAYKPTRDKDGSIKIGNTGTKIKCPPCNEITNTKTVTRYVLDSAAISACRYSLAQERKAKQDLEKKYSVKDRKARVNFWIAVALGLLCLLLLFLLFNRPKFLK